jgi:hypothetical protein
VSREIGTKTARQWPSGARNLLQVFAVERIDRSTLATRRAGAKKHMLVRETLMVRIEKRRRYEIGVTGLDEPANVVARLARIRASTASRACKETYYKSLRGDP